MPSLFLFFCSQFFNGLQMIAGLRNYNVDFMFLMANAGGVWIALCIWLIANNFWVTYRQWLRTHPVGYSARLAVRMREMGYNVSVANRNISMVYIFFMADASLQWVTKYRWLTQIVFGLHAQTGLRNWLMGYIAIMATQVGSGLHFSSGLRILVSGCNLNMANRRQVLGYTPHLAYAKEAWVTSFPWLTHVHYGLQCFNGQSQY